jgi:hypothetical protein
MNRFVIAIAAVVAFGVGPMSAAELAKPTLRESNKKQPAARQANVRTPAGGDDAPSAISQIATSPARTVVFTEEREAAARTFVRNNRPEMEAVLDQLRLSKPTEYQQVICDLFRTSELFSAMRQTDRARHDTALKIWQVEAKTHLLAAQLASRPENAESLKSELRTTVEQLADLQIEQSANEVRQWEAKLRRAEGQRKKLEAGRGEFVNQRVDAILQAVGRVESGSKTDSNKSESK